MHDASLHDGLREHRCDGLGEALEPVDDGDQDIVDAAGLELVDDLKPELGAFGLLDPDADSDEVARAYRDDVARDSDMMSPRARCLAGG